MGNYPLIVRHQAHDKQLDNWYSGGAGGGPGGKGVRGDIFFIGGWGRRCKIVFFFTSKIIERKNAPPPRYHVKCAPGEGVIILF